nr:Ig-like domain-containing protein [bacterium]
MKKKIIVSAAIVAALAAVAAAYFLAGPLLFAPKIVGELKVISFAPQGSAVPVSADGVAVMFNRAVVPLSTLTGGRQRALPLSIEPSLPGKFSWLGTSGFIFRPDEPLRAATTYRVMLPAGVVSVDGYRLSEPVSWEFSTVAPRLLTMEPGDGESLLPREARLFFRFNIVMDAADVEKKIRITDESTGAEISVPREYSWGDDGHALAVRFKGELPWSAGIKVELPRGLKAKAGSIGTGSEVTLVYRTPDRNARVEKVTAVDMDEVGEEGPVEVELSSKKEKSLSAGSGICYLFTQPVTKKSFERAFRIEPAKGEAGATAGAKRAQPFYYFADYEGYAVAEAGGKEKRVE